MADERINKLGQLFNAATQHISGEVASTTAMPAAKSLQRVSNAIIDALAESDEPRYYHQDLDTGAKGDILRPVALGYKAGAMAAYAYEQGAKFLFGRGQRHHDFARKTQAQDAQFTPDGYEPQVAFKHSGEAQPGEDAAAHKARSASFYQNNIRALKQDGILGFAVKAAAVGAGTLIGAAFCGSDEKADALSARIAEGAHAFNAGARSMLLGAPMGAAVLAGVSIGLTASAAVAAWKGLRGLRQRATQDSAPAQQQEAPPPSSVDPTRGEAGVEAEEAQPDLKIRSRDGALAAMAEALSELNPDLEAGALPTTEDTTQWPAQPHDTIEWARQVMWPIDFEAYLKLSQPEKETWKAINRFMLRCKPSDA